jgi:signal transduction histidine kinase
MQQSDAKFFEQIYGDRNRLVQVLTNFLSNSIKFSNRDSQIVINLEILKEHIIKASRFNGNES